MRFTLKKSGAVPLSKTVPLPKAVLLLGWVSFFADISSEMMYPLLPLFLVGTIGAPAAALGLIEGAAQALVSTMSAAAGFLSDKLRTRTLFLRWGYGLPILGKGLIACAGVWPLVFAGRIIDRFGKGLRGSPRDALISGVTAKEDRGRAFGYNRAMDTAGALLGVLAAAGLMALFRDSSTQGALRTIFIASALLAGAALIVTWRVKDPQPEVSAASVQREKIFSLSIAKTLGADYWRAFGVLTLFAFANSSDAFLLLRASDLGLSPVKVVLAYALYNFGYAALSYPAGILGDRFGRWPVMKIGWAIYALVYAGFAFGFQGTVWPLFAMYGVYMAFTDGTSKALIADCVPAEKRASALGLVSMAAGFAALATNILCGFLWDRVNKGVPFLLCALFAVVALVLLERKKLTRENLTANDAKSL